MNTIVNIFYGILFFTAGFLIIKYRGRIKSLTGSFAWAEAYLGRGSTYFILLVIGCVFMFIGINFPFGTFNFLFER